MDGNYEWGIAHGMLLGALSMALFWILATLRDPAPMVDETKLQDIQEDVDRSYHDMSPEGRERFGSDMVNRIGINANYFGRPEPKKEVAE